MSPLEFYGGKTSHMHVASSAPSTLQRQLEALEMYTGSKGVHLRV